MNLKETIAFRINQLCELNNLSPSALAKLSGIDSSTIYSILGTKSKKPEVATIKKICDGLNVKLSYFFDIPEFDDLEQELK